MVAGETATQAAYQYCVALSGEHPPHTLELRLDYLHSARQRSALLEPTKPEDVAKMADKLQNGTPQEFWSYYGSSNSNGIPSTLS